MGGGRAAGGEQEGRARWWVRGEAGCGGGRGGRWLWLGGAASFFSSARFFLRAAAAGGREEGGGRFVDRVGGGRRFIWDRRLARALVGLFRLTNLMGGRGSAGLPVFAGGKDDGAPLRPDGSGGAGAGGAGGCRGGRGRGRRGGVFFFFVSFLGGGFLVGGGPPRGARGGRAAVAGFGAGRINPLFFTVRRGIVRSHRGGGVFGAGGGGGWRAIPLASGWEAPRWRGPGAPLRLSDGGCLAGGVGYGYFNPAFRGMDGGRHCSWWRKEGTGGG